MDVNPATGTPPYDGVLVVRTLAGVDHGEPLFRMTMGTAADDQPTTSVVRGAEALHAAVDQWLASLHRAVR